MGLFTWGSLPKAQDNAQTIDEAIQSAITAHEEDPTAHLGDGESLQQHKNNEIIDHPAYSVIDDKPKKNKFTLESYFENISCFTITGFSQNYLGFLWLATTSTLNNVATLRNNSDEFFASAPNLSKNPIFEIVGSYKTNYSYVGYFGIGDWYSGAFIGFKASDTSAYADYYDNDGVEHTIILSGVNPKVLHKYRIEIVDGVSVTWFVDNLQVAQISLVTTVLADPNGTANIFSIYIKTLSSGHTADFGAQRLLYQQDLIEE